MFMDFVLFTQSYHLFDPVAFYRINSSFMKFFGFFFSSVPPTPCHFCLFISWWFVGLKSMSDRYLRFSGVGTILELFGNY